MKGLRLKQVEEKVGFKRSKIYDMIVEGQFPRPVKIGRANVWIEAEIDAALEEIIKKQKEKVS